MLFKPVIPAGLFLVLCLCVVVPGAETIIYEVDSAYNHIIVAEDDQGVRSLLFEEEGALQSVVKPDDPDYLELPYVRAMLVGVGFVTPPKRMLVVGLGGGTIPRFLHKHYPGATIDVVDIDPAVVAVAKEFFGFKEDRLLKVHVADGRKFIEQCRISYDIVFLDAYGSDNIPYHLATREFLMAARKAVGPEGIVVGNVWSRYSNDLYDDMVKTYQAAFAELYIFDVRASGNKIFVGVPRTRAVRRNELASGARAIGQKKGFPYDLGDVVLYGFRNATTERVDGRILTDEDRPQKQEKTEKRRPEGGQANAGQATSASVTSKVTSWPASG